MARKVYQMNFRFRNDGSNEIIWEIPEEHKAEAQAVRGHDGLVKFIFNMLENGALNPALDHTGMIPPSVQQELELKHKEAQAAYAEKLGANIHDIRIAMDEISKRAVQVAGDQTAEDYEEFERLTEVLQETMSELHGVSIPIFWPNWPYCQLADLQMSYSVFSRTGFELIRPDIYDPFHLNRMSLELYGIDGSWDPRAVITHSRAIQHSIIEVKDGVRIDNDIAQLRRFKEHMPGGVEINMILTERAWVERKYFYPHATRVLLWDADIGLLEEL